MEGMKQCDIMCGDSTVAATLKFTFGLFLNNLAVTVKQKKVSFDCLDLFRPALICGRS